MIDYIILCILLLKMSIIHTYTNIVIQQYHQMHYPQPPYMNTGSNTHPNPNANNSKQQNLQNNQDNNTKISKPGYKIPKNLCQQCYQTSGRYILDCYCIICQQCYNKYHHQGNNNNSKSSNNGSVCPLCNRPTKGNKIDAKQESSLKKIGHLFQNVDTGMQRMLEVYKFQNQIVSRYCQYLQKQLNSYQSAVTQMIAINPNTYSFFNTRVKLKRSINKQTQLHTNHHHSTSSVSMKQDQTVKPSREYASQIYQSRRSTMEYTQNRDNTHHHNKNNIRDNNMQEMPGIRPIGRAAGHTNHSGNVVYKVPNMNLNTAIRSSQRVPRGGYQRSPAPYQYDQDRQFYRNHNKKQ